MCQENTPAKTAGADQRATDMISVFMRDQDIADI